MIVQVWENSDEQGYRALRARAPRPRSNRNSAKMWESSVQDQYDTGLKGNHSFAVRGNTGGVPAWHA